ncbi:galactosyltransferase-related protein [Niabella ginsengisoli]|uniref:Galactosyltransferase-related protein n=1 Tax=Niabella ginsengisoli TaxID=522298 RepID=A0ABS9SMT4_9BACT|nr:galactosyltransferase-related protein [Niabella ginsengisoli]
MKVNGYDESFVGWGLEDNDIAIRLLNAGIKKRFLKFGGICYHLNHFLASRTGEEENRNRLDRVINDKIIKAENGMNQYIDPKPQES